MLLITNNMPRLEDDGRQRKWSRRPPQTPYPTSATREQQVFRQPNPPYNDRNDYYQTGANCEDILVSPASVHTRAFYTPPTHWNASPNPFTPAHHPYAAHTHHQRHPYEYHNPRSEYYGRSPPSTPYNPNYGAQSPSFYPASARTQYPKSPYAPSLAEHSPPSRNAGFALLEPMRYDDTFQSPLGVDRYTPYHYSSPFYESRPSTQHLEGDPSIPPPQTIFTSGSELVYDLRDQDVLCGRGAPTNFHPGNQLFRELVAKFQSAYLASRRSDKPEIATQIVKAIQKRGGRFLKRTKMPGLGPSGHFCWKDIGEQRAYEKACQALRENAPEIRRRLAAQELAAAVSSDSHSLTEASAGADRKVGPASDTTRRRDDEI